MIVNGHWLLFAEPLELSCFEEESGGDEDTEDVDILTLLDGDVINVTLINYH